MNVDVMMYVFLEKRSFHSYMFTFKLEATALTGKGIIWSIDPLHCTGTKRRPSMDNGWHGHDQAIRKAALKVGPKAAPKVKAAAPKAVSLV